jgi:hypothetical protein
MDLIGDQIFCAEQINIPLDLPEILKVFFNYIFFN